MANDIEILLLDEATRILLPTCFQAIYTKIAYAKEETSHIHVYSRRYRSREFSVSADEKPISKIVPRGDHR